MVRFTIVDYNADGVSEDLLATVVKHVKGTINDWTERDYGLKVFVTVPDENVSAFKSAVNKLRGFDLDD